jgi:hypothetical protein
MNELERKIVIDDKEYDVSEFEIETQMHVARVAEIRQEIARLKVDLNEREVVLSAYEEAIIKAVKSVEDEEPEAQVVQ